MDWNELRDRLSALPALEQKMEQLLGQIWEAKGEVDALLKTYERERLNTQRIKGESLSSSILKLTGRYEDRLEREQQDEISAKIQYDQAVTKLAYLRGEQQELGTRIAALKKDEETFSAELENRRSKMKGAEYAALDKEYNEVIGQITKVKEALMTASRVHLTAKKALKCMQNANKWASVDGASSGGAGMLSHIAKYDNLDAAELNFNLLTTELGELKVELGGVKDLKTLDISGLDQLAKGETAAEFWIKNVFVDVSQKTNPAEVQLITDNIAGIEAALELKLHELSTILKANRQREQELIMKQ